MSVEIAILDLDVVSIKGDITLVFVIQVRNSLIQWTTENRSAKVQPARKWTRHLLTGVLAHTVLLQTAKATMHSPENSHRNVTVEIILDGGSQRSYVTKKLRDAINLLVSHSESLTMKPFGSNTVSHQQCKVVNLCIDIKIRYKR